MEQDRLIQQIQGHQSADRKYYEDGFKLLELAAKAHQLYKTQPPEQKNKLLKILLSNCTLQDGTLRPVYKKPFDILARGVESRNGVSDGFRTRDLRRLSDNYSDNYSAH